MTHLVLPALHSLTGCDITSEVGTKKVGLKAKPNTFLYFTDPHSGHYSKGWALLGRCFEKGSECTTFTDLRAHMFHFSKASSIHNIPPTSEGLLPHIKHAFYNAYTTMHALEIQRSFALNITMVNWYRPHLGKPLILIGQSSVRVVNVII